MMTGITAGNTLVGESIFLRFGLDLMVMGPSLKPKEDLRRDLEELNANKVEGDHLYHVHQLTL